MDQLDKKDIQGIILKGYSDLPSATFLLLTMGADGGKSLQVKQWLAQLIPSITPADSKPSVTALNIAFTHSGLQALGLDKTALDSFPMEFEDGMTPPHKQQLLGDYGTSDPAVWEWGGPGTEPIHILLMLYAVDVPALQRLCETTVAEAESHGLKLVRKLESNLLPQQKEHFGFHDGISQPTIQGLDRQDSPENVVAAGEFILGYKNEYDQFPDTPVLEGPAANPLPAAVSQPGKRDLGKNGSYLVFRQIAQNVPAFWRYMDQASRTESDAGGNTEEMIQLAARMVGRWPSGAPLILSPDKDRSEMAERNDFNFHASDPEGMKCPLSAHVRRTNPRDAIDAPGAAALQIIKRHRILRRGRPYGKPLAESMEPADMLRNADDAADRGLYFICFNADIGRQFEFIQSVWINDPKFNGRHDERDPISGNYASPFTPELSPTFSVQRDGLRKRYCNIPEFVSTKGGAYFFMPGIKAIQTLSAI